MRTVTRLAVTMVLGMFSLGAASPSAPVPADSIATAPPCGVDLQATSIPGDPNAATVRLNAAVPGSTVTAYGAVTAWSGTVQQFARADRYGRTEYSFVVRAAGPIEAILYQTANESCLAHAPVRPQNGYDGLNVERPAVMLANPQQIEPIACAHRYAAARVIQAAEPQTPTIAAANRITGVVYVGIVLDVRGTATSAKVITTPSPVLNDVSVKAALQSTYSPEIFRCLAVPGYYVFGVMYS